MLTVGLTLNGIPIAIKLNFSFSMTHFAKQLRHSHNITKNNQIGYSSSKTECDSYNFFTKFRINTKLIIKRNWSVIENDTILIEVFPPPPVISFRQAPALWDRLIQADSSRQKCTHCPQRDNVFWTKSFVDLSFNVWKLFRLIDIGSTKMVGAVSGLCARTLRL